MKNDSTILLSDREYHNKCGGVILFRSNIGFICENCGIVQRPEENRRAEAGCTNE